MLYEQSNPERLQQLAGFKKEKEELVIRKNELLQHETKIQQLMIDLEAKNEESTASTFASLNNEFSEIFEVFCPDGCAKLRSRTCHADANGMKVELVVSFTSKSLDEVIDFNLLTDERKRIVAIALILAIQRCELAPFYLFDGILEVRMVFGLISLQSA